MKNPLAISKIIRIFAVPKNTTARPLPSVSQRITALFHIRTLLFTTEYLFGKARTQSLTIYRRIGSTSCVVLAIVGTVFGFCRLRRFYD